MIFSFSHQRKNIAHQVFKWMLFLLFLREPFLKKLMIRILKKAERPGADELARNSRARSAKLRIAERLADEINDAGEHHREKAERE